MRNLVLLFAPVWCFVPLQPPLQFSEDHPGSEKQLWFFIRYSARDPRNAYKSWTRRWEQSESLQQREGVPSWAPPHLGSSGEELCLPRPLHSASSPPWCHGDARQWSLTSTAGRAVPATPKAQLGCFRAGTTIQVSDQAPGGFRPGLVPQCSARALPVLLLHSHWALLGRCESNCSNWLQKAQLPWDTGFFHSYGVCP